MMAIAAKTGIYIHQIDVDNAYLNTELEHEFYIKELTGFKSGKKVYQHLNHILYSLKQFDFE